MRYFLEDTKRTEYKTAVGALDALRKSIHTVRRDVEALLQLVEEGKPFRYAVVYGFNRIDFVMED